MKQKGLFSLILTIFFVLSLSAVEGWKPAEEPRTKKAASEMRTKAEEREKKAEQARQEAERKEEPDRAREEELELNVERARYDLNTAKIGEVKLTLEEPGIDKEQIQRVQRELTQAQLDRQAIETRIEALSKGVEAAYEWPTLAEDPAKWNDYYNNVQKEIAAAPGEELRVLKRSRLSAKRDYADYNEQRNALEQLHDLATDQQDKEVDKFAQELQDRIVEIDAFLKNPPQALPQNAVATRLKLNKMIPSDQVFAVKKEFLSIKDNVADLRLLRGAMKRYGIDTTEPQFTQIVEGAIEQLVPEKEMSVPEAAKTPEEQNRLSGALSSGAEFAKSILPEGVVEGVGVTADATAAYLTFSAGEIVRGLEFVIKSTPDFLRGTYENIRLAGEKTVAGSVTTQQYVDIVVRAPEILDTLISTVDQLASLLEKYEPFVRVIPGKKGKMIVEKLEQAKAAIVTFKGLESRLKSSAETAASMASRVKNVAKLVESIGNSITEVMKPIETKEATREEVDEIADDIEKARLSIEEERYNIPPTQRMSKFKRSTKHVKGTGKKIGTWFKEKVFKVSRRKHTTATKNYNDARKAYLETIGITREEIAKKPTTGQIYLETIGFTTEEIAKKPTTEQIRAKLQTVIADKAKKQQLQQANDTLAQRTNELAQIYKEFADKLESMQANYELVVKGWDTVSSQEPKIIAGMVNTVFDMRAERLEYLQAIRDSLDDLATDINTVSKGTEFQDFTDRFIDNLSKMISGQEIQAIAEYDKVIDDIDANLVQQQKVIEKYSSVEFAQPG